MNELVAPQASSDYARIEKAINFLCRQSLDQPDLAAAARSVHLSEFHFQRLFTRWAGISPKRFVQFLTVQYAKARLLDASTVLETAMDSGLSGPSRLHDLFVSVEAVTPGEFKSRGAGIEIRYGLHPTPFGLCLLGLTDRGICWLSFVERFMGSASVSTISPLETRAELEALAELKSHWTGAVLTPAPKATGELVKSIFTSLRDGSRPLSLLLMGTNFQLKVWQALLSIPEGRVVSYETVGRLAGAAGASRAIGGAVGGNPVAFLIPCHRVIRKTGSLGGYRWGESRKRAILAWEAARIHG